MFFIFLFCFCFRDWETFFVVVLIDGCVQIIPTYISGEPLPSYLGENGYNVQIACCDTYWHSEKADRNTISHAGVWLRDNLFDSSATSLQDEGFSCDSLCTAGAGLLFGQSGGYPKVFLDLLLREALFQSAFSSWDVPIREDAGFFFVDGIKYAVTTSSSRHDIIVPFLNSAKL